MKDQIDKLPSAVAARATVVNSSLPADEVEARLGALAAGRVSLLLAAPERLRRRDFVRDARGCANRPRRRRRGALREHVGPRLPPGLPVHPGRTRRARGAAGARPHRHRDARHRGRDRPRARPRLPRRARERRPAEPPPRRRPRRLATRTASGRCWRGSPGRTARRSSTPAPASRARGSRASSAATASARSTTTPGWSRTSGRRRRTPSSPAPCGWWWRRPRSGWGSTSRTSGSCCSTTSRARSRTTCRWSAGPGRDGRPSDCVLFSGRRDALALRRFAERDVPETDALRDLYRVPPSARRGRRRRRVRRRARGRTSTTPASSSACSSRPGSCAAASTAGAR